MSALYLEMQSLSRATLDRVAHELQLQGDIGGRDAPHNERIEQLIRAARRNGTHDVLEARVASARSRLIADRDGAAPFDRNRLLVRSLADRAARPTEVVAELISLGVEWPAPDDWGDLVCGVDGATRQRLLVWALPVDELTSEPKCLMRIAAALLASGLTRNGLLTTAAHAGISAMLTEQPLDVWVHGLVQQAARTRDLRSWLALVALQLDDAGEVCALELSDLRQRWKELADQTDAETAERLTARRVVARRPLRSFIRCADDVLPVLKLGNKGVLSQVGAERQLDDELYVAARDLAGPPWRWRRGAVRALAVYDGLSEAVDDPQGHRYEAAELVCLYRRRTRSGGVAAMSGIWLGLVALAPESVAGLLCVGWLSRMLAAPAMWFVTATGVVATVGSGTSLWSFGVAPDLQEAPKELGMRPVTWQLPPVRPQDRVDTPFASGSSSEPPRAPQRKTSSPTRSEPDRGGRPERGEDMRTGRAALPDLSSISTLRRFPRPSSYSERS